MLRVVPTDERSAVDFRGSEAAVCLQRATSYGSPDTVDGTLPHVARFRFARPVRETSASCYGYEPAKAAHADERLVVRVQESSRLPAPALRVTGNGNVGISPMPSRSVAALLLREPSLATLHDLATGAQSRSAPPCSSLGHTGSTVQSAISTPPAVDPPAPRAALYLLARELGYDGRLRAAILRPARSSSTGRGRALDNTCGVPFSAAHRRPAFRWSYSFYFV